MDSQFVSDNSLDKSTTELASNGNLEELQKTWEEKLQVTSDLNNSTEDLFEKLVPSEVDTEDKPVEVSAIATSNISSDQQLYMTELIPELCLPTTNTSEEIITSQAEHKPVYSSSQAADDSNPLQLLLNGEPEESTSAESYSSQKPIPLTISEQQLLLYPLSESYTLVDKIDMSGVLSVGNEKFNNSNIEEKLLYIMQQPENWDVKVYVGEKKFYCQHVILQMFSPYFLLCKLENTDAIRLPESKVTAQAFNVIYKWMLQEQPIITKNLNNRCLLEIYNSAKFLGITELVDFVCNTLDTVRNENDGFALLSDMSDLDMRGFECLFLSRISKFFLTLVSSLEFVEMPYTLIKHLLSSHNLGVNSEIEVFYALVRWLSHKWPQRRKHVTDLVECIRFGLLPPMFLHFLQNTQSTRVMHHINSIPEVKDMIEKAFVFTSAERYCKDPPDQLLLQLPNYAIPEPRKWLFDGKCPYHHSFMCSQRQFFTYEQFLGYLEMLHYLKPNHWKKLKYLDDATVCCPR